MIRSRHGGDFVGLQGKLDYIKGLGCQAWDVLLEKYPPSGGHFEQENLAIVTLSHKTLFTIILSIFGIPWYTHGIPRIPVGQPRIPMGQPMTCNPWEMAIPLDLSWWRSHHPQAIWISPIFQNGSGAQSIEMSPYVRPCLMCITVDTLDANLFPIFVVK